MAQFSVKIIGLTGSVLGENQQPAAFMAVEPTIIVLMFRIVAKRDATA